MPVKWPETLAGARYMLIRTEQRALPAFKVTGLPADIDLKRVAYSFLTKGLEGDARNTLRRICGAVFDAQLYLNKNTLRRAADGAERSMVAAQPFPSFR